MKKLIILAVATAGLVACVPSDACDQYVDYICECHADDPDYDCQSLRIIHQDADGDMLADCQVSLTEQKDEDEASGDSCDVGDTGTAR